MTSTAQLEMQLESTRTELTELQSFRGDKQVTPEQELYTSANYATRRFKEHMLYLYALEFDKVETEEIEDLLVNFYSEMKERETQCREPQL